MSRLALDIELEQKPGVLDIFLILIYYYTLSERKEKQCLTAFWPSTVHRMASDALARTARSMYVGSMYFTSEWTPISPK
jgi:hypothetical protein